MLDSFWVGEFDLSRGRELAEKADRKQLRAEIKNTKESIHTMMIAMKSMNRFQSAFEADSESTV